MWRFAAAPFLTCAFWIAGISSAQVPAKVDFARDVLPLFRQNCVSCHGPAQQTNGLRLDRRSSVLRSGLSRRVIPGNRVCDMKVENRRGSFLDPNNRAYMIRSIRGRSHA